MSWLRNLQGQLTDLANEVLSEATEEVADPDTELQVASKKAAESERQLTAEKGKVELLEKRCTDLEQNLLDAQTEMDLSRAKFEAMIGSRDQELKKLKIELEQLHSQLEHHEPTVVKMTPPDIAARDKALSLLADVQSQLVTLRCQKDDEIAAIVEQHTHTMQELRDNYEEKLRNLEASFPASTSQSGISIIGSTTAEHPDLSAVHDELENLALTQSGELQMDVLKREEEMQKMQLIVQELTDVNQALSDRLEQQTSQLSGYESLKRQTAELTRAYNDLNTEYEVYKESNGGIAIRNQDLVQRIDTLRANLIEYEERYEQCRREHAETEKQLLQLTEDFSRLKDAVDKESPLEEELNRLKNALEASKGEGLLLKSEVERFRDTVAMFEEELEELRLLNRRLVEDNEKMGRTIRELQNDPTEEKYEAVVSHMREEADALRQKNTILEEKVNLMQQYQDLSADNESGEKERTELLEQKVRLLEQVRDGLKERIAEMEEKRHLGVPEGQSACSLTNQLREALAANSEKTEECEKLRADVEECKKEIGIRQNCVDDLIVQNNLLQVQYQDAAEQMQEQKPLIDEKERQILKLEQELHHLKEEMEQLEMEHLPQAGACASVSDSSFNIGKAMYDLDVERLKEQHDAEVQSLQSDVEASLSRIQQLQGELKEAVERPDHSDHVAQLQAQNEEFRRIVTEKHEESLRYYQELQNLHGQLQQRDAALTELSGRLSGMESVEEAMKREMATKEQLQKDLARLKAHLIHMEETTTQEAIEAEKREMDLRDMVSDLQKTHHSATEGATEHSRILELRVADITLRLDEAEKSIEYWKCEAESTEKQQKETTEALQSLQGVLKEISTDHEKESAVYQHSNAELHRKVQDLKNDISSASSEMDKLKLDKQAVEDDLEAAKRDIYGRQKIIDLENQMEETKTAARTSNTSYTIDDETLRSLFMTYFTSPMDKRADIAVLLANILQYSKEDVDKILASLYPNGKPQQRTPPRLSGLSLTEQFVRFLENESESSRTAPQLPVDRQQQPSNRGSLSISPIPSDNSQVRVPASQQNQCLDELLKQ